MTNGHPFSGRACPARARAKSRRKTGHSTFGIRHLPAESLQLFLHGRLAGPSSSERLLGLHAFLLLLAAELVELLVVLELDVVVIALQVQVILHVRGLVGRRTCS